jgi:hypothetical protein
MQVFIVIEVIDFIRLGTVFALFTAVTCSEFILKGIAL